MRRIELDPDRKCLVLSFPYDASLVEVVRTFPERRFDRETKTWSVPVDHAREVVAALRELRFVPSPAVEEIVASVGPAGSVNEEPSTLRVSEVNSRVRRAILEACPESLWVAGEIAGFDRNRGKRHVYFELVEKQEGAEKPRARVAAVLFERRKSSVRRRLEQASEPFELRDGIEVRFRVRVDLYEPSGSYQLIVEDVDPVHTLGKLALARQEILNKLMERGLRERNRGLPLSPLPLRVAVITSHGSDAFNDVVKELEQSGFGFRLAVFDARMQGKELQATVAAGLRHFARQAADHDVLLLARGGGARSDLIWFDDLELAVAVAEHPLKVICGIGHQRDESVLDCITTSAKTPTAAAQILVGRVQAAEAVLVERLIAVVGEARRSVLEATERLSQQGARIERAAGACLRAARQETQYRAAFVVRAVRGALRAARLGALNRADRLTTATRLATRTGAEQVQAALKALRADRMRAIIERAARQVAGKENRLRALDPARVLKRGFAVVRGTGGRVVTGVAGLQQGDEVDVSLRDGHFEADIKKISPGHRPPAGEN